MNARSVISCCLLVAAFVTARAEQVHRLHEITVLARRPVSEIGVVKTSFDSLALKENIALSMADILSFNSSVFVKNYGRATLSTVAFRGTSPAHTQVTWNGIKINSPMLGMTDFSTIPSFFVDRASLLHGNASINETAGGIGGQVSLATAPLSQKGWNVTYVQGIGSFKTFDEFVRVAWADSAWSVSTRAVVSSSPNDYKYINHDKKLNIYDENNNIIDRYHPRERNKSGAYRDAHILQEVYFNAGRGHRLGLNAWYYDSNRELPMITSDYGDDREFENRQREHTFRGVLSWYFRNSKWNSALKAGYIHTRMAYDYKREVSAGNWAVMTRSRSRLNTLSLIYNAEFAPRHNWLFTANVSAQQQFARSVDKNVILVNGHDAVVGYDKARPEVSAALSAKWQPVKQIGVSVVGRQEMTGKRFSPFIPAVFADVLVWPRFNLMVKASASRNYRTPTLNDLYFLPGGNPDLRSERGFNYDAGASAGCSRDGMMLNGSLTWFDNHISDWIIWLPTTKGFFSPRNVAKVHSYGIEAKTSMSIAFAGHWNFFLNVNYSWTPSINRGEKLSPADRSPGKQLPYIPRHTASATARLGWKTWAFTYKWSYYSRRYTMSSNDLTITGTLPVYYMNNVSLDKSFSFRPLDLQLKLAVNNLFNEDYISVLSRPMPGINFEFFVTVTPKFGHRSKN